MKREKDAEMIQKCAEMMPEEEGAIYCKDGTAVL